MSPKGRGRGLTGEHGSFSASPPACPTSRGLRTLGLGCVSFEPFPSPCVSVPASLKLVFIEQLLCVIIYLWIIRHPKAASLKTTPFSLHPIVVWVGWAVVPLGSRGDVVVGTGGLVSGCSFA